MQIRDLLLAAGLSMAAAAQPQGQIQTQLQGQPGPNQTQPRQAGPHGQMPPQGQGQPPGGDQQQAQKEPASIEGRVTNSTTGAPLKRANLMLLPVGGVGDMTPVTTAADSEGKFVIAEIPPGQYRLSADRTGFVRTEFGSRGGNRSGTTITLAPGQTLKQVDIAMLPHAVISGRVTDEDGEPVANVAVQAGTYRYINGRRQMTPGSSSMTNDLGEYRVFGLPPGRYYVSATPRNMGMFGAASASSGGARREPEQTYASTWYPGTADAGAAVQIPVAAGKPVANIDLRLLRSQSVRIRGRIANAPPGSRTMIMVVPRSSSMFFFDRNNTAARPDGRFEVRGVAPGSYFLIAQFFESETRMSARVPLDVGTASIDDLEVTLSPGQDLTGSFKIEGDTQIDPAGLRVFLEPKEMSIMGGPSTGPLQPDGTFRARNVLPDTYRVRVFGGSTPIYLKSVRAGQDESADGEVTVLPGVTQSITVVISTAGAQVTGEVKNDKDAVVQGATVVLVPETGKREQSALYKIATTDQYGKYTLKGIAPGSYKLFAWESVDPGQWMDPDFLQPHENNGKAVNLAENGKETVELKLLKTE